MKAILKGPLWDLTRGQRGRYAAAILAMGLSNVFLFGVPLISKTAIDGALGGEAALGAVEAAASGAGSGAAESGGAAGGLIARGEQLFSTYAADQSVAAALYVAAALIGLLTALGGVCLYLRGRWASVASEAIVQTLRQRLFQHLERLPATYHDRADTGDLVQRCTSDVETIRVFLTGQVVEIGRTILLVLTVLPVMLALDGTMTAVSLVMFPVIFVFAVIFFRRVQDLFLESDQAEGALTAVLQENLTGIRVVRAFARQDFERKKFAVKNEDFRDRTNKLIRFLGVYWSISDFLCLFQLGGTLVFGAWWAAAGHITVGTLFAFLTYQAIVIWPVRHLGRVLTDTGKALVALGRVREILEVDEEPTPAEALSAERIAALPGGKLPEPAELAGAIEFRGVTFAHDSSGPVLDDLDFRVEAGQTLALLGPPGAGKSTVVQLLLRLYDYDTGSIRLDGMELDTLDRAFVRSQVGVVLQQPFLYSKTIGANVRVGRSEASQEDVTAAAAAACIHGSIEGFDQGYETLIGERGVTLSGGQRQRLAIARALVKDPAVLVLDDALSAVDTQTEAEILDAVRRRKGQRTTILIAHRLSSVVDADRILVLDEGRIVQAGTHRVLLDQPGVYARLWSIQNAMEEEIEADLQAAAGKEERS